PIAIPPPFADMTKPSVSSTTEKPPDYYQNARVSLVDDLPRPIGRVLDIGCANGAASTPLREAGASWITGIEIDEDAAARARERYDEVLLGNAESLVGELDGPFNTILCYDVLEHMVHPENVLDAL